VVGAVRDVNKAEAASASVRDAAWKAGGRLQFIQLNVASLQSVRACANRLLRATQQLDAIIANAGVMAPPFGRTVDGFELQSGTTIWDTSPSFIGLRSCLGITVASWCYRRLRIGWLMSTWTIPIRAAGLRPIRCLRTIQDGERALCRGVSTGVIVPAASGQRR
jgi:NAD(P)-dependent dehydrogenase (short-subunit alcohol dehydrogenase family)